MNVLIADDEQIVLEGLKYIIDWNALGFTICATAVNGEEALEKILALKPDLCLMDIKMPKKNGIEVVQAAVDQGSSSSAAFRISRWPRPPCATGWIST